MVSEVPEVNVMSGSSRIGNMPTAKRLGLLLMMVTISVILISDCSSNVYAEELPTDGEIASAAKEYFDYLKGRGYPVASYKTLKVHKKGGWYGGSDETVNYVIFFIYYKSGSPYNDGECAILIKSGAKWVFREPLPGEDHLLHGYSEGWVTTDLGDSGLGLTEVILIAAIAVVGVGAAIFARKTLMKKPATVPAREPLQPVKPVQVPPEIKMPPQKPPYKGAVEQKRLWDEYVRLRNIFKNNEKVMDFINEFDHFQNKLKDSDGDIIPERLQELKDAIRRGDWQVPTTESTNYETMKEVGKVGLNLTTMFTPGLNDARDLYEVTTGRDLIDGRELAIWERALSAVGLVFGSGAAFRKGFQWAGKGLRWVGEGLERGVTLVKIGFGKVRGKLQKLGRRGAQSLSEWWLSIKNRFWGPGEHMPKNFKPRVQKLGKPSKYIAGVTEREANYIRNRVENLPDAVEVWAMGSRVAGSKRKYVPGSDIDILVVTKGDPFSPQNPHVMRYIEKAEKDLSRHLKMKVSITPISEENFFRDWAHKVPMKPIE